MQIAWDLLERSGEITDPGDVSRFLLGNIDDMMRAGRASAAHACEQCDRGEPLATNQQLAVLLQPL